MSRRRHRPVSRDAEYRQIHAEALLAMSRLFSRTEAWDSSVSLRILDRIAHYTRPPR